MSAKHPADRITIPFETLRSYMPQTFDVLASTVEFRAVVNGKLVSERKTWVGIGWSGHGAADGTEPILVIDEETVHAEIRAARANESKMPKGNYDRLWLRCHRCFRYQHVDYVPFSLSTAIRLSVCGHRYEDLDEVVTFEQRVGKSRVAIDWHMDIMDVLNRRARKYIDGLKESKRSKTRSKP